MINVETPTRLRASTTLAKVFCYHAGRVILRLVASVVS
jgi:hypothetical protein